MRVMARSIKEIANGMKAEFVGNENLRTAYAPELDDFDTNTDPDEQAAYYDEHFSAVSVETCLIYIVATCAAALEHMMDWFKEDVDEIVANERYGHKGWYEKVAKNFQYDGQNDFGFDEATGTYDTEGPKIIRHASCEENGHGVKLKLAKEDLGGELSPLAPDEKTAFQAYINRMKPAGIPVRVISEPADTLNPKMTVWYDPIIYNEDTAKEEVKGTITQYLSDIDFNGEFVSQTMVDRLQAVPGLDVIEVSEVEAKHAGYGYTHIDHEARYIPYSGYMRLEDDENVLELTMIANV